MKSKTSFFNKGIFFDDLRRFGWIGVAYLLVLFFVVPLQILMTYSADKLYKDLFKSLFHFTNSEIQGMLIVAVPVFIAIFLFRYIQVKISSDMIHSLPIKRSALYISHVIIGVMLLIVPVLIIAAICIIMKSTLDLGQYYRIYDVIQWCGITILMDMVFFFSCVFAGMIVGLSVMQGALTYIFLFLPAGLMALLTFNLEVFLYGFIYNLDDGINKLSPIVRILYGFNGVNEFDKGMSTTEITVYIALCIILFFSAIFIYSKRKLEAATQPIAFKTLQYVFKYGATFCMMLVGGLYFLQTQKKLSWVYFGFLIGSLIGYFAAEMILKKSIWVFRSVKGYIIYAIAMVVMITGINLDIVGYEKKLPVLNDVNKIYFSEGYYNEKFQKYDMNTYYDKNNLKYIYDFHKKIIEDKNKNKYKDDKDLRSIFFMYQLKDGSKIQRAYRIDYDEYKKYLKPIYQCSEFKKNRYDILKADASDIEKITIHPSFGVNKQSVIVKPEDIKEALDVLKQDISNETYEDMDNKKTGWADISFMVASDKLDKYRKLKDKELHGDDKQIHTTWRKSYKLFEEWLKKKGYIENARVLPADIQYAVVEKITSTQQLEEKRKTGQYINNNNVKRLEIKDKNQIEACLRNYDYPHNNGNAKYIIGFYNNEKKNVDNGSFDENDAPDFVKDYFNK
ncbi:DUF6449 domain-containing protein [Clostridium aciditolerans]|uniref:ABC transporter permease n=1 Tax=Clostridium aciditolerans TaxID=339861 RepID=A0A934HRL9_9CLOT|nr:DUF6449 domain-containing protein [Clostridium aciditolerans]MBI6872028.1 ABC transporter permease [Clostridium aciditolerans]